MSGFDYKTCAMLVRGGRPSTDRVREFASSAKMMHDHMQESTRIIEQLRREIFARDQEIMILKQSLLDTENKKDQL